MEEQQKITCMSCGKSFVPEFKRQYVRKKKFCDWDCYSAFVAKEKVTIVCACGCGRSRLVSPSTAKGGAQFYNRQCAQKGRVKKITVTCKCGCGRSKDINPSEVIAGKGIFFNRECMLEYQATQALERKKTLAVKTGDNRIIRRSTNDVINRLNNDKTLISGSNAIADIVGCDPAQVGALARHDRYKFPCPFESISAGNTFRNFYKLDEVIAYKEVYKTLLANGTAKEYQGFNKSKPTETLAELAVKFFGGKPSALLNFGRAVPDDDKNPEKQEPIDTSLSKTWNQKNKAVMVENYFTGVWL